MNRDEDVNPNDSDPLLKKKVESAESSNGSSGEIKDEEIEASSAVCCRICLEHDSDAGYFVLYNFAVFKLVYGEFVLVGATFLCIWL